MSVSKQRMIYHNESRGELTLDEVRRAISQFMELYPDCRYQVIVGSDSHAHCEGHTDFVTAIIVHRIGSGGIYFWQRSDDRKKYALKERIFMEATASLVTAQELVELFRTNGISNINVQIHVDIGTRGPTRAWIQEVVSMIRNSGFLVKIKPESFGASKVADRHT